MIGAAAATFLLLSDRIMRALGILGGLVDGLGRKNSQERLSFLAVFMQVQGYWLSFIRAVLRRMRPATTVS